VRCLRACFRCSGSVQLAWAMSRRSSATLTKFGRRHHDEGDGGPHSAIWAPSRRPLDPILSASRLAFALSLPGVTLGSDAARAAKSGVRERDPGPEMTQPDSDAYLAAPAVQAQVGRLSNQSRTARS
jgi:hypothetical protein